MLGVPVVVDRGLVVGLRTEGVVLLRIEPCLLRGLGLGPREDLVEVAAVVAQAGANIEEVHHQRAFSMLSAQNVEVELVLQTRNRAHVASVIDAMTATGFDASAY